MFMRGRSTSESSLHYETYLKLTMMFSYLALICVMGKGSSVAQRVLIDYNVGILRDALLQVFRV